MMKWAALSLLAFNFSLFATAADFKPEEIPPQIPLFGEGIVVFHLH
jgi:hypothetical protein